MGGCASCCGHISIFKINICICTTCLVFFTVSVFEWKIWWCHQWFRLKRKFKQHLKEKHPSNTPGIMVLHRNPGATILQSQEISNAITVTLQLCGQEKKFHTSTGFRFELDFFTAHSRWNPLNVACFSGVSTTSYLSVSASSSIFLETDLKFSVGWANADSSKLTLQYQHVVLVSSSDHREHWA